MNRNIIPFVEAALAAQYLQERPRERKIEFIQKPDKIKTSTTAADVRSYIENFTLFRKISNPEWNLLKGRYSNRTIKEMTKDEILKVIS